MKLTRRRVLIAAIVVIAAAGLSLLLIVVLWPDRITQANIDRIQDGMTLEKMSDILGPPSHESYTFTVNRWQYQIHIDHTTYYWEGKNGVAHITVYSDSGRLIGRGFSSTKGRWWSRVKQFFGL